MKISLDSSEIRHAIFKQLKDKLNFEFAEDDLVITVVNDKTDASIDLNNETYIDIEDIYEIS